MFLNLKVILSRKGFDSKNGGYPSPILPNGKMISLPIPSDDFLGYSDLKLNYRGYKTYYDLMIDLKPNIKNGNMSIKLTRDTKCHCDPDINRSILDRKPGWRPIFGQVNSAQTHLKNQGVKEGDLFLFFGFFKEVIEHNGKVKFKPKAREIHAIFGFLQIGQIIERPNKNVIEWINYHPHVSREALRNRDNNTLYIATEKLSFNNKIPGAGTLKFSKNLVLTKDGYSKSRWSLPDFFRNVKISYHDHSSWKEEYFQSAMKGQEFVIEDNMEIENWAKRLISENFLQ